MSPLAVSREVQDAASEDLCEQDCELVRRCLAGEESAWRRMVDRYGRLVHSVCLAAGLAPPEAEDVCQEVMISALRGLRRYGGCRLSTWLYRIARRRIADYFRSPRRREAPSGLPEDPAFPAEPGAPAADAEEAAIHSCDQERALRELSRLDEPERSILAAYHIAEVPVRDIAAEMGLPENTVKSHLRRGRLELRRCLGGTP